MKQTGSLLRPAMVTAAVAAIVALGWWLGSLGARSGRSAARAQPQEPPREASLRYIPAPKPRETKSGREYRPGPVDLEAILSDALPGQRTLRFRDDASMQRFLDSLDGSGMRLLGVIPGLRAVRIGFDDASVLAGLPEDADPGMIYPVLVPNPPDAEAQAGAVPLGAGLADWLGVGGDRSSWGKGVTVAILDTGVGEHPSLTGTVLRNVLVALPADPADFHGHGTAVASLIAGNHPLIPGVAPGVDLLSIRVADDFGVSDTFTLAQGIFDAVAAGADIINISMGSTGDSALLREAVAYATEQGAVIVASAGNSGAGSLAYPAAYPQVLGVGAVDAAGSYLEFSNYAETLSAAAPGFGINAAWPGDSLIAFSGTSASAPILAGAIAAAMSPGTGVSLTGQQAANAVLSHLDEAGYPGNDPLYGGGTIDLGRVLRRDQPGVVDAAIASNVISYSGANPELLVTVENRGTALIVNAAVNVTTPAGSTLLNVTTLPAGRTQTFTVPLPGNAFDASQPFRVQSSVTTGSSAVDAFPANNTRTRVDVPLVPANAG